MLSPETCLTTGPVLTLDPLPGWPFLLLCFPSSTSTFSSFPFFGSPLSIVLGLWDAGSLARLLPPELYEWGDRLYPTLYPRLFPFCLDSLTPGGPEQCGHYSVHHVEMI